MGFWSRTLSVSKCVVTLGGSERLRTANERLLNARAAYARIVENATGLSGRLTGLLRILGSQAEFAFKRLRVAQKILSPLEKRVGKTEMTISAVRQDVALTDSRNYSLALREFTAVKAAAGATLVGTTIGVGSWTAVSLLGSASTGIGIGVLHGVAATNATLAWFGGGSLASGGLGMAGGTFVLGGIVLLPGAVIGVSAWWTHSEATKAHHEAEQIEKANEKNREAVRLLENRILKVTQLVPQFKSRVEQLSADVGRIQKVLFPFGWLSRLWREIRLHFVGYYYDHTEMSSVEELAKSVEQFISQFKEQRELLSAKASS